MLKRAVRQVAGMIPNNLSVFLAAIFLSNFVNLFNMVYGTDKQPARAHALSLSCLASLGAAGFWTALAAKTEQLEKTVASAPPEAGPRSAKRDKLWDEVWVRVGIYLGAAIVFSVVALVVLLDRSV